jgi:uncharacterized membrane protein
MWWYHGSGWSAIVMTIAMLAFWGGLAYLVMAAVSGNGMARRSTTADARSVLDARLARGEIDPVEYRDRITALTEAHDA